jgi:hypothetical protein
MKHTTIYTTIKKEPKEHHYTATLRYTSPQFTQLHFIKVSLCVCPLTTQFNNSALL